MRAQAANSLTVPPQRKWRTGRSKQYWSHEGFVEALGRQLGCYSDGYSPGCGGDYCLWRSS